MSEGMSDKTCAHRAFIVYLKNNTDRGRKQILILSDILCLCGIDCKIDQYFKNDDVLSWPQQISHQIDNCISKEGHILLEISQSMYDILNSPDNPLITMIDGFIDCQGIRHYLQNNTNRFVPFFIDEVSSCTPHSLSAMTPYIFPFSKLPKLFTSDSFTQKDVHQLLDNPDFTSLKSLVAKLTKQQEIPQPDIQPCRFPQKLNRINPFEIEKSMPYHKPQSLMLKIFMHICEVLPTSTYFTVNEITKNPKFADAIVEMESVLKTNTSYLVINECLLWYLYKKCNYCFSLLESTLKNIFDKQDILTSVNLNEHEKNILVAFYVDKDLPEKLTASQNFTELQQYYHLLIQWMPDDFQLTIIHFKDCLRQDQITYILESHNFHVANKRLMYCLIERIAHKSDLLELCDQLHKLYAPRFVKAIIDELKAEIRVSESLNAIATKLEDHHDSDTFAPTCKFSKCSYFQPLPKLPSYYINRKELIEDMINVLYCTGNVLIVTGAGGYGKTTLIIALCNHSSIRDKFANHIIFFSLGPQTNKSITFTKLKKLYFDLTGKPIENSNVSDIKMHFKKIIASCSHDILVVINDVWDYDDAEPILNIFDKCTVVLTSRMNNISQYVKFTKIIDVREMKLNEAIELLSYNLPDFRSSGEDDKKALEDLAENAHLWPLLLFLIRGQLHHYLQCYDMNCHNAIKNVKNRLDYKGLTAFDKHCSAANRTHSAKVCIDTTLDLLHDEDMKKLKSLILFTGIGGSFPRLALSRLWNIPKHRAEKITDTLCSFGLLSQVCYALPIYCERNIYQDSVVTHMVLSKYITDYIMTEEIEHLSPHISSVKNNSLILEELTVLFKRCYGVDNLLSLTPKEYLIYMLSVIEHVIIPHYLKMIMMHTLHDPHLMLLMLQKLQTIINSSRNVTNIFIQFSEKIVKLNSECNELLRKSYKSNRKLHTKVEQDFHDREYDVLTQTLEDHHESASIGSVASKCIELVKEIIPHADSQLTKEFELLNEMLLIKTHKYHSVNMEKLPIIKIYISVHQEIDTVLKIGGEEIWKLYKTLAFTDELKKKFESIIQNYYSTLQLVAPNITIDSLLYSMKGLSLM